MYIQFELAKPTDNLNSDFKRLRAGLFKLHFTKWAERHNIRDYQFSYWEGRVRIEFKHTSDYSVFGLAWRDYNNYSYSIVQA